MAEKITLANLKKYKETGRPITMLTCYDYATAVLMQQAQIDSLLVGDSLAQVILGHDSTLNATMDIMIALTAAVRRGAPDVYLVGDMPFLSYQLSIEKALINAGRFLTEAGCDCVKLEVDHRHLKVVESLCAAGIPVMAHLGFRPQSIHQTGQPVAQGRSARQALQLVRDMDDMVKAGACAGLLECVPAPVAQAIARRTHLPVIGCGSGPHCDGQVMVQHDMLSLPGAGSARFAQAYAQIGAEIRTAVEKYIEDVHQKQYPQPQHCYNMKDEQQAEFEEKLPQKQPPPLGGGK
jgi:3-methyl-2-oxobutanoate hydroxymethyltransferase